MTDASAAGRKTEKSLQTDIIETVHHMLAGVREALARIEKAPDRERETGNAVRLSAASAQLTNAFSKLRAEERQLW